VEFGDGESMQPLVKMFIETETPDLTPPEIDVRIGEITISGEPTQPEAPNGETKVQITFWARDPPDPTSGASSGIGPVSGVLLDPQGGQHHQWFDHSNNHTTFFQGGDPSEWKQYDWEIILPQGSAPGTWGLQGIHLEDKAGNVFNADFTEIFRFEVAG